MSRSLEFPMSAEGTVWFDKPTMCAFERAFENNKEVVRELAGIVGEENAKLFREIFINTGDDGIRFLPSDIQKTFYSQIAKIELERIEAKDEDDDDISCGHSIDEHTDALRTVLEKMKQTVN